MSEDLTTATGQTAGEAGSSATPATVGAVTPPQTGGPDGSTSAAFTQADIDRIVKQRLAEEQARQAAKAKKAQEDAEAKRLAEQGQFEALAKQQEAAAAQALTELEAMRGQMTEYQAIVEGAYKARLKAMPKEAQRAVESIPGLTVAQKLAWLEENAPLFTKLAPPDINAGGDGAGLKGQQGMTDDERQRIASKYNVNPRYVQ